jgi:hypothetical protein
VVQGGGFGFVMSKVHRLDSCMVLSEELVVSTKVDFKTLKCYLGNHYHQDPHVKGVMHSKVHGRLLVYFSDASPLNVVVLKIT